MHQLLKYFLIVIFSVFSLFLAILLINFLLPYLCKNCRPGFIVQLIDEAKFDSNYVYWGNSACENNCDDHLSLFATSPVVKFGSNDENCKKILVLGDSFTDSPWDHDGFSYTEHFARNIADNNDTQCYKLIRVATNGSGNDQQYARFLDIIDDIKPNLVIWQFCWNDFYDNTEKALYKYENGSFSRIQAFNNAYFWAGWLYQNSSLISETNLGEFILYFGELKKDFKLDWLELNSDFELLFNYNDKKITFFLDNLRNLSENNNFQFLTTLSPLECELVDQETYAQFSIKPPDISCDNFYLVHNKMLDILQNNSAYISMYDNKSTTEEQNLNIFDFWEGDIESATGLRHLSASGQEKAGDILFQNYIEFNN